MTRTEIEKLESWLHDGAHLLCSFLLDRAESRLEPRTTISEPSPIPAPKRKRGRPRKEPNAQKPLTSADVEKIAANWEAIRKIEDEEKTCPYCNRILPASVLELHKENCRAAAQGYATHVAQPGRGS